MEITPLGDSALIIRDEFRSGVGAALHALRAAEIAGVMEYAPSYNSIGVFFDVARIGVLEKELREAIQTAETTPPSPSDLNTIEISVCCDAEFALDLDEVARHAGLSAEEVVRRYCDASYTVACIGFMPGFGYLTGLPNELSTPRRATPRKQVPAGAVAIGGAQTGVYPTVSPGGWNIIGRTSLRLFDPRNNPPALLEAGNGVRFRAISREQFDAITR